jgi:hypothetical protein
MQILESRRWRRRLIISAILAAFVPIAFVAVHYSQGGDPRNANGPTIPDYKQPKPSPFTASEKAEVRPLLKEFILSAVARENVDRSFDLASNELKAGTTRKEWDRGELPVSPYPAADRGLGEWSYIEYSYKDTVGMEVFLFPKPGSGSSALSADVEVVKDPKGRWLVNYWMPKRFHGPPALSAAQLKAAQKATKNKKRKAASAPKRSAEPQARETPQIGGAWWAIPLGLLSLIVLVPLGIMLVYWLQNRKAQRLYG